MERRPRRETIEERWLDVDTAIIYDGNKPAGIWFRYFTKERVLQEAQLPVDNPDDAHGIYGGLMAWTGRCCGDKLIAAQYAGEWHDLPDPMPA